MKKVVTYTALMTFAGVVNANADEMSKLEIVEVYADRIESNIVSPARQVTEISRDTIQAQVTVGASLAEVIAKLVPGMAQPSQTFTNYAQSLRGREALVLVDGVPMNTNRDVSRVLFNTSSDSIERIEVIRGGNAIYGSGATGGVIMMTTREPTADLVRETGVSVTTPTSFANSDALTYRAFQGLSGEINDFDYAATLSYESIGAKYDGNGNRIAPEPSQGDMFDASALDVSTKLGWNLSLTQRIQVNILHFTADQDTDYGSDPSVRQQPLQSVSAAAIEGLELDDQNMAKNSVVSLEYTQDDILNSQLHAQLYYRDYLTRFYPFDGRAQANNKHIAQTELDAQIKGGRFTMTTPFDFLQNQSSELVWGFDLQSDKSSMPVLTYDGTAYDQSNGLTFVKTGEKIYMPPITTEDVGAFSQLRHRFNSHWSIDLGVRYETVDTSFDNFITLPQTVSATPMTTQGGEISYSDWLTNISTVFSLNEYHELYASYNEGFELPDVGLQVRNAKAGFNLAASDLQALKTDTVELGWRGHWDAISGTLALYQSTSDLGRVQTQNFGLSLFRNKEKISGFEATINSEVAESFQIGSTLSVVKGEETPQGGTTVDMDGFRIPPLKFTLNLTHETDGRWSNTVQALYSAGHDYTRDGVASFGRRNVESYWTLDWMSQWQLASGRIQAGVENLLNKNYYPVYSQLLRSGNNTSHIPAQGRTLRVAYVVYW